MLGTSNKPAEPVKLKLTDAAFVRTAFRNRGHRLPSFAPHVPPPVAEVLQLLMVSFLAASAHDDSLGDEALRRMDIAGQKLDHEDQRHVLNIMMAAASEFGVPGYGR